MFWKAVCSDAEQMCAGQSASFPGKCIPWHCLRSAMLFFYITDKLPHVLDQVKASKGTMQVCGSGDHGKQGSNLTFNSLFSQTFQTLGRKANTHITGNPHMYCLLTLSRKNHEMLKS